MKLHRIYFLGIGLFLNTNISFAQIFSQGKNINNEKVFSIKVEMEPKPMDQGKYHAILEFYGQRKDIKWYLKEGVEHKAFINEDDLIAYMRKNGWIYLQKEVTASSRTHNVREKYVFRKSMNKLSQEHEQQTTVNGYAKN